MDKNTHVYCVDCKWFRLYDEYIPYCVYETTCEINNCEDSKPFRERPCYEEKDNPCKTCGTQRCYPEYCDKIVIKPKVENEKILLDKNNPDHYYIMEEE